MNSNAIENLLLQKEDMNIEFKRAGNGPQNDTFETICAFLNRYGGDLLLGVTDDGEVIGLPAGAVENMKRHLVNVVSDPNQFAPPQVLFPECVECRGKTIIHVHIPQSAEVHRYKGVCYDRAHEADVKIDSTDAIAQMYIRKQRIYTEQKVYPLVTINEMRLDLMPRIRNLARSARSDHPWLDMSDDQILRSAKFCGRDWETGREGFNAAGILCLGCDDVIQGLFPAYKTDAIFRVVNLDRYDDRDQVCTNLIESYDRLIAFGEKHLDDRFFMEDGIRVSLRSKILREAIGNILVHREYSSARPGRIVIGRDTLVADNPNKAITHGMITPENMCPVAKNPVIAKFFQNIGRADDLGSGVRNLFKYSRLYSGVDPVLDEEDIFTLTISIGVPTANDPLNVSLDPVKSDKVPIKSDKVPINLEDEPLFVIAEYVYSEIEKHPGRNRESLAGVLGLSVITVKRAVAELRKIPARIEHRGSNKTGGYYALPTPKGSRA